MRKLLCCLFLILCANGYGSTLLILGDSISAGYGIDAEKGWVNLLQQELASTHSIINGSISGDTTGGGLSRLPTLLEKYQPQFVLIELGGNDGLRGHPLSRMKQNLQAMIQLCIDNNAQPILFGMQIPPNYGRRYAEQFASIYPDLSKEAGVPLISFAFEELISQEGMMQDDGIHPTERAQPIITQKLLNSLRPIIE